MTDTAIAPYEIQNETSPAGPGAEHAMNLDRKSIDLLKKTVATGTTDQEFELFVRIVRHTGLDPFAKQIYCIKRGDKMTIQTSIDGYRLIAARTGQLAGIDDAQFDTENAEHPARATVTVYRIIQGHRAAFTATARWSEYAQSFKGALGDMWKRMPYTMLAKCAEALALRKGFPQELSSVRTDEEMDQAGGVRNVNSPRGQEAKNTAPSTAVQWRTAFIRMATDKGWTTPEAQKALFELVDLHLSEEEQIAQIRDLGKSLKSGLLTPPDAPAAKVEAEGWEKE